MTKSLSFALTFLMASSFPLAQPADVDRSHWSTKDFWAETKLKFDFITRGGIPYDKCLGDYTLFSGCVNGLNAGIGAAESGKKILLVRPSGKAGAIGGFEVFALEFENPAEIKTKMAEYETALEDWYHFYWQRGGFLQTSISFEKAYTHFRGQYVNPSNEAYLAGLVFNGFLEKAVDPHTYIVPTKKLEEMAKGSTKVGTARGAYGLFYAPLKYEGKKKLLVVEVMDKSPAEKEGLEEGDVILAVNGKEVTDEMVAEMKATDSADFEVTGPKGTRTVKLARVEVVSESVESGLYRSVGRRPFGYIKLTTFRDPKGCEKIIEHGRRLKKKGIEGIILDLRDNRGGLVTVATCLNRQFLEYKSQIFANKNLQTNKVEREFNEDPTGAFRDMHAVVLINGNSASASEAVSMYLQGYRKAFIVGETSFGKGTMQIIGASGLQGIDMGRTVAKYFGPQGISPQIQGVVPDVEAFFLYNQDKPGVYERERDLYSNAVANKLSPPPVMEERVEEVRKIKECLRRNQLLKRAYESKNEFKKRVHDNQKAAALGTLDCAVESGIPVFSRLDIPRVGL